MTATKFKTRNLLKETLVDMQVGATMEIFQDEFRSETVRWTVAHLNNENRKYAVTCKGMKDRVIVTRVK